MRKSVCILIALLVFLAGCACPAQLPAPQPTPLPPQPSVDTESALKLARKFSPIIYLSAEGKVTESYEPRQIEVMVDDAMIRDIQNPSFAEKASLANLPRWSKSAYYLDLADLAPKSQTPTDYQKTYAGIRDRYRPTLYARVKEGTGSQHTVLQYWLFYYANDWRNFHEGDWELVQLHFPPQSAIELLDSNASPFFAAYSQHQYGQRMSWHEMTAQSLVEDTHPKVYVARGSHANYFTPGTNWAVLDFDDTGLAEWQVIGADRFDIVMLPEEEGDRRGLDWVAFKGRWGEYLGFSISVLGLVFRQAGPFGPLWNENEQKNERWQYPEIWAEKLPEYPKPFWTAFLQLPGDITKLAVFSLFSPAELHVYDAQGRHVGLSDRGELELQIPGAMYITPEGTDYKTIIIPDADIANEYQVRAKGTNAGIMDLKAQIPDIATQVKKFVEYLGVPLTAKTVARAQIRPAPPALAAARVPGVRVERLESVRDTATALDIDSDGDGVFEAESTPGQFEKRVKPERKETEPTQRGTIIPTPPQTPGLVPQTKEAEQNPAPPPTEEQPSRLN